MLGSGPLRSDMMARTRTVEMGQAVSSPGSVEHVRPSLDDMRNLILTSRREGFSIACIEAPAMGVPVTTTPVSWVEELVGPGGGGDGGVIVPARTPHKIPAAVWERAESRAIARESAVRAGQRAGAWFVVTDSATRMYAVIAKCSASDEHVSAK